MEQSIFKVGDRVYHYRNKWGIVQETTEYSIDVKFSDSLSIISIEPALQTLSFTEYDFINGGFSQERPKPEIKHGQLVYVKNGALWEMRYFSHFQGNDLYCYQLQEENGSTSIWSEYSLTNPLEEK